MDTETRIPTCYRHVDRETRLSCSSCGRPVCVDCVRSAPVGQKCLECANPRDDQRVITSREMYGGLRSRAPVTFAIIVLCVGVFVLQYVGLGGALAALGEQDNDLLRAEPWRLITTAFLHGGPIHVAFNMYALSAFGPGIERQVGGPAFLGLYLASAIAGGAAFFAFDVLIAGGGSSAVGASGAIFGLFGATLGAAFRQRRTPAGQAGLRQLLTLLGINLALPLLVPQIAWQAHVGGLVAGVVIATVWGTTASGSRGSAVRIGISAAVALVSVASVYLLG